MNATIFRVTTQRIIIKNVYQQVNRGENGTMKILDFISKKKVRKRKKRWNKQKKNDRFKFKLINNYPFTLQNTPTKRQILQAGLRN